MRNSKNYPHPLIFLFKKRQHSDKKTHLKKLRFIQNLEENENTYVRNVNGVIFIYL